ncbi:hypothetical protein GCM10010178_44610 [Lentzea flava]|uniref:DUF5753 domain-containing protein n=2 Tax=Lentzea flava TaxID=103732 RepID=A0ABQ2UQU4_9PSEU|nr:hypothetical protein [Lentzea flava]GGU47129.1 hypothetical protein GCM10010178_44610 [Lentzea flava]
MSLAKACETSGFSVATLSLIENGIKPLDPLDIMILGRIYELPNDTWKREVRRAEYASNERASGESKQRLNAPEDVDKSYLEAVTLYALGTDMLPRFVHTPEYRISATTLGCPTYPGDSPASTAERHAGWIRRLASTKGSSMTVEVLVTEDAVRRVVGNPTITNAALVQLVHLSEIEHFKVQVIEREFCLDARLESSYMHLTFPHRQHDDVVYIERSGSGRYIEDPAVCQLVQQSFKALQRSALTPTLSVELIAEVASSLAFDLSR